MNLMDFDFEWCGGKLNVRDYQLAAMFETCTGLLNQRCKRKMILQSNAPQKMILPNDGLEVRPGGRVKPVCLYDTAMIKALSWDGRIPLGNTEIYNAAVSFCSALRLPCRDVGVWKLLGAFRSNSRYNDYSSPTVNYALNKPSMLPLPSGVLLALPPLPFSIVIDRLTVNFSCEMPEKNLPGFLDSLKRRLLEMKVNSKRQEGSFVLLETGRPFSQLREQHGNTFKFRLDWNPAKVPLQKALLPLECLLSLLPKYNGRACLFRMSRLDVAVDYPCAVGLPMLSDISIKPSGIRKTALIGEGPDKTVYYGSDPRIVKIYDKTKEILARRISRKVRKRLIEQNGVNDVFRFEAELRHRAARDCLRRNPFERCPFPKIRLEDGSMIPSPSEIYEKWFPDMYDHFVEELYAGIVRVSGWNLECKGGLDGVVDLIPSPAIPKSRAS